MTEKKYKYEAKIKQPQTVGDVKLSPQGGFLSEREIKTVKRDVYGVSLLEKGLLVIGEAPVTETDTPPARASGGSDEAVPDFEAKGASKKRSDRPEDHAGWKPE
jgi:hypothetical protein